MRQIFAVALSVTLFAGAAAAGPAIKSDIVYGRGGEAELHMDIARPEGEGPFPALLLIHGGSWRSGSKAFYGPLLTQFAEAGYVAAAVEYRLAPKAKWPAQIEDCKCAVRFLRAHAADYDIDPERIGALGVSAGAHLALLLGLMEPEDGCEGEGGWAEQSSAVSVVVNFFGPTDLRPLKGRIVRDFMGADPEDDPEGYDLASPLKHIDAKDGPVLTLHGTNDPIVPYRQATSLTMALKASGVTTELVSVEGAGHGWGGARLEESLERTRAFLNTHLKAAKARPEPRLY